MQTPLAVVSTTTATITHPTTENNVVNINIKDQPESTSTAALVIPKSSLVSRNVTVSGHRTSVRLEPEMWNGLAEICRRECASAHEICTIISAHKPDSTSLTAAIRVFVMAYYRAAATEDGHSRAGHGPGGQLMMSMMAARSSAIKK